MLKLRRDMLLGYQEDRFCNTEIDFQIHEFESCLI